MEGDHFGRPGNYSTVGSKPRVRALLEWFPDMPGSVLAERVDWKGSMTWFRENVARLRPEYRKIDPADRVTRDPGDASQWDLWFPPRKIPLERLSWVQRFFDICVKSRLTVMCTKSPTLSGRQK
jgi:hypothetical protein